MIQKTKIQCLAALLLLGVTAQAQVSIGTTTQAHASASLEIASDSKGMLPPRMTQAQRDAIASPAAGLTVYNLTQHCLNFHDGAQWKSFCGGLPGTIASLDCASRAQSGLFKVNVLSAGSKIITYAGGNGGRYEAITIASTGVTGLTASAPAGAFASTGTITLAITGTPSSVGTATFALSLGGRDCTFNIDVPSYLYGGTSTDYAYSIKPTADGGYIMAGNSFSSASGDVAGTSKGATDAWVVKLAASGAIQWERLYGGNGNDYARSIVQTPDGGYIVAGESTSSASGDVTGTSKGNYDIWVLRLDASGNILWNRLYGGTSGEYTKNVELTADGGCVIMARAQSPIGGDITGPATSTENMWILKLAANGTKMWDRLYGSADNFTSYGNSIQPTADGGYIVIGISPGTVGGNIPANYGNGDVWVMKLTATGAIAWNRVYGGSGLDSGHSIRQTADGGYIFAAETNSPVSGLVTIAGKGGNDCWIVKLTAAGAITWQKRYGGDARDEPTDINLTADGGYIVTALIFSSVSGDVSLASYGSLDAWILKLNASGNLVWQKRYGGNGGEEISSISPLPGGGYIAAGQSSSSATGNIGQLNHGNYDAWVMELDALGNRIPFTGH